MGKTAFGPRKLQNVFFSSLRSEVIFFFSRFLYRVDFFSSGNIMVKKFFVNIFFFLIDINKGNLI